MEIIVEKTLRYRMVGKVFVCCNDEGSGTGKCKTKYQSASKNLFSNHNSKVHNMTAGRRILFNNGKGTTARRLRATKMASAASFLTHFKETTSQYPFEELGTDDSPGKKKMLEVLEEEAEAYRNQPNDLPYYAILYVWYFLPEELEEDMGIEWMIQWYGHDPTFTFDYHFSSSYFTTCNSCDPKQSLKKKEMKMVVDMRAGAHCYRQNYIFQTGTSKENRYDALYWVAFWKTVFRFAATVLDPPPPHQAKMITHGNRKPSKTGFSGILDVEDRKLAAEFAFKKPFMFPLPMHFLPDDQTPLFLPHNIN